MIISPSLKVSGNELQGILNDQRVISTFPSFDIFWNWPKMRKVQIRQLLRIDLNLSGWGREWMIDRLLYLFFEGDIRL